MNNRVTRALKHADDLRVKGEEGEELWKRAFRQAFNGEDPSLREAAWEYVVSLAHNAPEDWDNNDLEDAVLDGEVALSLLKRGLELGFERGRAQDGPEKRELPALRAPPPWWDYRSERALDRFRDDKKWARGALGDTLGLPPTGAEPWKYYDWGEGLAPIPAEKAEMYADLSAALAKWRRADGSLHVNAVATVLVNACRLEAPENLNDTLEVPDGIIIPVYRPRHHDVERASPGGLLPPAYFAPRTRLYVVKECAERIVHKLGCREEEAVTWLLADEPLSPPWIRATLRATPTGWIDLHISPAASAHEVSEMYQHARAQWEEDFAKMQEKALKRDLPKPHTGFPNAIGLEEHTVRFLLFAHEHRQAGKSWETIADEWRSTEPQTEIQNSKYMRNIYSEHRSFLEGPS